MPKEVCELCKGGPLYGHIAGCSRLAQELPISVGALVDGLRSQRNPYRHFISPESIIATLARSIERDPDDLAFQWQVEDGEFKGIVLFERLTRDEAACLEAKR